MALEMARILCPVDFSPCARGALELAVELAARLGASVDVLHVWEPVRYAAPEPLVPGPIEGDRVRCEGQRDLDALVAFARERAAAWRPATPGTPSCAWRRASPTT